MAQVERLRPGARAAAVWLAAAVAVLVYANGLRNGFAYDDVAIIQRDSTIHSLANVPSLFTRGYWSDDAALALYRPLTAASFALDWQLSGGDPVWFHAVNIAWHALATALATLLMAYLFGGMAALAGGIIFAVHPVHVEAVSNIVGRADVMAGAFVFLAALIWVRTGGWLRLTGFLACFAAGLLCKESVIGLPLLLPLLDAAAGRLRRDNGMRYVRDHALSYLAAALLGAVYLALRFQVLHTLAPTRVDPALELATGGVARVLTALQAWPQIFRLLLFPRTLLADYGPRILMPAAGFGLQVFAGALLLGALLIAGLRAFLRQRGQQAMLLLWVPVALLPVSNFLVPIGVLVAERILYVPSFALAAFAGVLFASALAHAHRLVPMAAIAALLLVVDAAALRTWTRTPVWNSTDEVLRALLKDRPDSFRAQWHHARVWRTRGRPDSALVIYRRALSVWPYRRGLVDEAASYEAEQGQLRQARALASFAAARWPEDLAAHRIAAGAALDMGDSAAARAHVAAGLAVDPDDALLRRMAAALVPANPGRK